MSGPLSEQFQLTSGPNIVGNDRNLALESCFLKALALDYDQVHNIASPASVTGPGGVVRVVNMRRDPPQLDASDLERKYVLSRYFQGADSAESDSIDQPAIVSLFEVLADIKLVGAFALVSDEQLQQAGLERERLASPDDPAGARTEVFGGVGANDDEGSALVLADDLEGRSWVRKRVVAKDLVGSRPRPAILFVSIKANSDTFGDFVPYVDLFGATISSTKLDVFFVNVLSKCDVGGGGQVQDTRLTKVEKTAELRLKTFRLPAKLDRKVLNGGMTIVLHAAGDISGHGDNGIVATICIPQLSASDLIDSYQDDLIPELLRAAYNDRFPIQPTFSFVNVVNDYDGKLLGGPNGKLLDGHYVISTDIDLTGDRPGCAPEYMALARRLRKQLLTFKFRPNFLRSDLVSQQDDTHTTTVRRSIDVLLAQGKTNINAAADTISQHLLPPPDPERYPLGHTGSG